MGILEVFEPLFTEIRLPTKRFDTREAEVMEEDKLMGDEKVC